jgi:peptide-methionine (R)-S-oxide reductase
MDTSNTPQDKKWEEKLTPEQFAVLRQKETEAPFTHPMLHEKRDGMYRCAACGQTLFTSDTKFDSGSGWPSFDDAIPGSTKQVDDTSHGMTRTEVVCSNCGSHLGHLFNDGPTTTGMRYCVNGVSLEFSEADKVALNEFDKNNSKK